MGKGGRRKEFTFITAGPFTRCQVLRWLQMIHLTHSVFMTTLFLSCYKLKEWDFRKLKVACGRSHSWQASNRPRIQMLAIPIPDSMLFLRPFSSLCSTVTNCTVLKESSLCFELNEDVLFKVFLVSSKCTRLLRNT